MGHPYLKIELSAPGQMSVHIEGLPLDRIVLYGLLDAAKDQIRAECDKALRPAIMVPKLALPMPFLKNNGAERG